MSNLQVKNGQTIYDLLLITYGSLELTYKLIAENENITSIDFDFDSNPNEVVSWDKSYVVSIPGQLERSATIVENNTGTIESADRQTVYDLCLMTYGSIDTLYKLITDNSINTVDDTSLSGLLLTFDKTQVTDNIMLNYINKYGIVMCTGDSVDEVNSYNGSFNLSFN